MALTLISTHTVDAACGCIDITSGITSTYDSYEFHCVNMHPATNNVNFTFQVNASNDTGGGFDTSVITSTSFRSYLKTDGSGGAFGYDGNSDQANAAGYQRILSTGTGNETKECVSGVMTLFAPASTTYVKHFTAVGNGTDHGDYTVSSFMAGYINQTLAIPEISFKFDSGNIDAGTIKMFGVS
jgi:hypothetical protein